MRLRFGDYTLDVTERLLLRRGSPLTLPPKTFDLLAVLVSCPGRLLTKDELLKRVWPDSFVEESNLAYHVFALRRALGEKPDGSQYVETIPKSGYRFVADVESLGGGANGQSDTAESSRKPPRLANRTAAAWFVVGAFSILAILAALTFGRSAEVVEAVHAEVSTEIQLNESSAFAISPDGRDLVFAGSGLDGITRLWVRSLNTGEVRPLPGTDVALGGLVPPMFWSPDSRFVAFDAVGQLKKIEVAGGSPQTVCELPGLAVGGSWSAEGVILVGSPQGGIVSCPAEGGAASIITRPDTLQQHSAHLFPWFLPGGRQFLYLSISRTMPEKSGVFVHSLDSGPEDVSDVHVIASRFGAAFVEGASGQPGQLLFMRDGELLAQPFDAARLRLEGAASRVAGDVGSFLDGAFFSASQSGALAFRAPPEALHLTWMDERGNVVETIGDASLYSGLAVAPDHNRVVVAKRALEASPDQDLWLIELPTGSSTRLTFDPRIEDRPVWSNDGRRIFFTATGTIGSLFEQAIGDDSRARLLLESSEHKIPTSASPDGRFLLYTNVTIGPDRCDVWLMPLSGDGPPKPFIHRAFDQDQAQFSPDGTWVAYVSNESGRREVLARPVWDGHADAESIVVSRAGGTAPRWKPDGTELFFLTPDGTVAAAPVIKGSELEFGPPTMRFQADDIESQWDIVADGNQLRFLALAPPRGTAKTSFSLIFHWRAMLSQR